MKLLARSIVYALLICISIYKVEGQKLKFSAGRGLYDSSFSLVLSTTIPDGKIRYTLDGSSPSVAAGILYSDPIKIKTTSIVRAIAYNEAIDTTSVHTNTYVFIHDVVKQPEAIDGWPIKMFNIGLSPISVLQDYEMDPDVVENPEYKDDILKGLKSIPTMSVVLNKDDFWEVYGDKNGDTIRKSSVEIIYPDGTSEQVDCGLKGHSWRRLKRSMRLEFKKEYGAGKFETNLFRGVSWNKDNATKTLDNIILRAGNNRSWARSFNPDRTTYTEDEWARSSQVAISGIGVHGNFVHLYINGLYWGLYNPVERPDDKFNSAYFGGDNKDWLSVSEAKIFNGDSTRWVYLRDSLWRKNMTVDANYQELKNYLDVEEFIDYLIISWMCGKTDWPQNNWWAGHSNNPVSPMKYFVWDSEWSWDTTNGANMGAWVHPQFRKGKGQGVSMVNLFNFAKKNKDFMMLLADRVYKHCFNNGPLTDENSRKRWALINAYIKNAIIAESARWGDGLDDGKTRTKGEYWIPNVQRIDSLMNGNVERFINALLVEGYYPLVEPPRFNRESGVTPNGFVVELSTSSETGIIYLTTDGSDPRLSGGAVSGNAFTYNEGINISKSLKIKARVKEGNVWSVLHEAEYTIVPSGIYINEIVASNTKGIKDNYDEFEDWIEIYNSNDYPVNIGGIYITDDFKKPDMFMITDTLPQATSISSKGYKILWADKQPEQGADHVGIKLSAQGDQVGLFVIASDQVVLIDSTSFKAIAPDVSRGRVEDGADKFVYFKIPTPDSSNKIIEITGTGPNYISAGKAINIYPNPFGQSFTIDILNQDEEDYLIELYDLNGKLLSKLYEGKLIKGFHQQVNFDKNESKAGVYILKVHSDRLNAIYRLIKN